MRENVDLGNYVALREDARNVDSLQLIHSLRVDPRYSVSGSRTTGIRDILPLIEYPADNRPMQLTRAEFSGIIYSAVIRAR